ncbi:MAG: hypothetical protein H6Q42_780 [Deltaproteobacteria bacterium]|nr:hypothetical protein [Deltaproteobacteria bacterium]
MTDEMNPEEKDGEEGDSLSEEEALLDQITVTPEDSAQFPSELILETQAPLHDEQRQTVYQKILQLTVPQKIRLAMLGNREARNILIQDRNRIISMAVLRSPKLSENDALSYAQQRNLPQDVFAVLGKNKRWTKYYPVKLALVNNPKTPLHISMRFIEYLTERDLKALSRNKNVSSVLNQSARNTLQKRGKQA